MQEDGKNQMESFSIPFKMIFQVILKRIPFDSIRWMQQKFDGIRVFWNGQNTLQTVHKKLISAPSSVLRQLPSQVPFEAQLWLDVW